MIIILLKRGHLSPIFFHLALDLGLVEVFFLLFLLLLIHMHGLKSNTYCHNPYYALSNLG